MPRLRLLDFRLSRGPQLVGICQGIAILFEKLPSDAQERIINDRGAGNEGWWGAWAKVAYNVARAHPYITTSRYVSRLEYLDVCKRPVPIQNEFEEFLEFGIGLQPRNACNPGCRFPQNYDRGLFPTFIDIAPTNKTLRVFMTDPGDVGKRVLIQGLDSQGEIIFSQDGLQPTVGEFLMLQMPFSQFPLEISQITGIQKDVTIGVVRFYEVDLTTGDMVLLLTMEGSETVASYRRYFLDGLPLNCCDNNPQAGTSAQVVGMAKLELIPAQQDSDWLLIQSLEALISECQSIRFDGMDSPGADQKSAMKHHQAIGFLNGQLTDKLGKTRPAAIVKPFGNATLRRQGIGTLI